MYQSFKQGQIWFCVKGQGLKPYLTLYLMYYFWRWKLWLKILVELLKRYENLTRCVSLMDYVGSCSIFNTKEVKKFLGK